MIRAILDFITGYPTEIDSLTERLRTALEHRRRFERENGALRELVRALRDVNADLDRRNVALEPRPRVEVMP